MGLDAIVNCARFRLGRFALPFPAHTVIDEDGAQLIRGARQLTISLGERGIPIRSFQARSTKPDGIRLMRHMRFTETEPNIPGMRDFSIDVESSGLPLLREYKDALRRWQEAQQTTVMPQ
jgi:hypothetical protein